MDKLTDGVRKFRRNVFESKRKLFEELARGQHPVALFITCSDSRVDPALVTQTEPGDLFVIRNAGNIVPPYSAAIGGEAASIEYAVDVLGVEQIVVCGHSQCGAMQGVLDKSKVESVRAVGTWLHYADDVRRVVDEKLGDASDEERIDFAVRTNALMQLENLRSHPSVARALAEGKVELYAWVYEFETGRVLTFDRDSGDYYALDA